MIGGKALRFFLKSGSKIIAANSGRQSSNGLVERTWRTIIEMSRAYITEKHVGREFWLEDWRPAFAAMTLLPDLRMNRRALPPINFLSAADGDAVEGVIFHFGAG